MWGLEPVPRDVDAALAGIGIAPPTTTQAFTLLDLAPPDTPFVRWIEHYAKAHLSPETFNHSMRVYYIGSAVLRSYLSSTWGRSLSQDPTTYFVSALLHDIGTTEAHIGATHLSFEYYGGIYARELILKNGRQHGVDDAYTGGMADSVCETIIRHQDVGKRGFVSANTQLIQIATLFDNMGGHQQLVSNATFNAIYSAYPRGPWSSCFSAVIHKECELKPYSSTTRLGEEAFSKGVLANPLNRFEH